MLKSGNGEPKKCVENLISLTRGEVPFDRVRGIDARIIDSPAEEAALDLQQEARWNIETYEPRVNADKTVINTVEAGAGNFKLEIDVSENFDEET